MNGTELKLNSRSDFEQLLLHILSPLKPYYSPECARLELGETAAVYDFTAAEAEGFLRPLWGLIPFWAGGGRDDGFQAIYQKGLVSGTDPANPEYWGGFHDIDQRFVEMAALSYGILMTPEIVWDPLTEQEQINLAEWLDGINHYECPPCNWMFFGILVNIALKSKQMPYNQTRLLEYLDYIESCYQGGGWYVDGQNGEKDYYVSFAFHYYGLIYARFMKSEDPDRCDTYESRACLFAKEFLYWFAEDGSALAYGRSLTYRLAQVSFFSMCAANGLEVLPLPELKGIIVRHLEFWMRQPIFDHAGILTIGYGYPNLLMAEQYNAPGSPYWCMKAFAVLSLPEDHPFWSACAAPLPAMEPQKTISNENMVIQRLGGQVSAYVTGRTLPHHHVHMEEKYSKFVYSSRYAFSVPRSMHTVEEAAPDSMLAFEYQNRIYTKGITTKHTVCQNSIHMEWSPCPGIQVKTTITLDETGHQRTHEITCEQPCAAYDCGFALPIRKTFAPTVTCIKNSISVGQEDSSYEVSTTSTEGRPFLIQASPNTSLMFPKTIIPSIRYELKPGSTCITTTFAELGVTGSQPHKDITS